MEIGPMELLLLPSLAQAFRMPYCRAVCRRFRLMMGSVDGILSIPTLSWLLSCRHHERFLYPDRGHGFDAHASSPETMAPMFTDNQNVPRVQAKGSSVPALAVATKLLFELCKADNIELLIEWIPRDLNAHADELSKAPDAQLATQSRVICRLTYMEGYI